MNSIAVLKFNCLIRGQSSLQVGTHFSLIGPSLISDGFMFNKKGSQAQVALKHDSVFPVPDL